MLDVASCRQGPRADRKRPRGRYDDAYAYQNVFGPLVALEAAHDRAMKEAQVLITLHHHAALAGGRMQGMDSDSSVVLCGW